MEDLTTANEVTRFSTLLGLVTSILLERLTGGTHVGRPFKDKEALQLARFLKVTENKEYISNVSELSEPLAKSFFALADATQRMMDYSKKPVDVTKVGDLLYYAGVSALQVINKLTVEKEFLGQQNAVEIYLLAAKIVAIVGYYENFRDQLGLQFPTTPSAHPELGSTVPTLPSSDAVEAAKAEFKQLKSDGVVDKMVSSPIGEEALRMMDCFHIRRAAKGSFDGMLNSTVRRGKGSAVRLRHNQSVKGPGKRNSTFSFATKLSRQYRRKRSGYLGGKASSAKRVVRTIFSIARILSKFTGNEVTIAPGGAIIHASNVPEVFKDNFTSMNSKSSNIRPIALATNHTCSAVLYHNNMVELFCNRTNKYLIHAVVKVQGRPVMYLDDSTLYIGDKTPRVTSYDVRTLKEMKSYQFSEKLGGVSALHKEFGILFIGYEKGKLQVWDPTFEQEYHFQVRGESRVDDLLVPSEFGKRVCQIAVDEISGKVATAYGKGFLMFWQDTRKTQTKSTLNLMETKHKEVTAMVAHLGELYTGGLDGFIRVWDFESETETYCIRKAHHAPEKPLDAGHPSQSVSMFSSVFQISGMGMIRKNLSHMGSFASVHEANNHTGQSEHIPYAVTSIAVEDDTIFSSGLDGYLKIWDLTVQETKPTPVAIECEHPILDLRLVGDKYLYALNDVFSKYEIEGLLYQFDDTDISNSKLTRSHHLTQSYKPGSTNDGRPTIVRQFERPEFLLSGRFKFSQRQNTEDAEGLTELADMSFDDVLNDRVLRKKFMKFLRKSDAHENLQFYISCKKYKKLYEHLTPKTREREAKSILKKFIEIGSPREINISDTKRKQLLDLDNKKYAFNSFDIVMNDAYNLMKNNYYHNFLKWMNGTTINGTSLHSRRAR